jgi:hypothetical protein
MNLFESRLLKLENSFCVFNEKVEKLKNIMKKNNYKPIDIDN